MAREFESGWQHVSDAIKINAHRGRAYAAITGGRSRSLTRLVITLERLCLLPLAFFDWWGKKYNRRGIHIIEADFVSMARINELTAPLRHNGRAGEEHRRALGCRLKKYRKMVLRSTLRGDFRRTSSDTFELLQYLHELEEDSRSLFPMTRHILESVGIAACNSIAYADESGGKTVLLSKMFLLFQILFVRASVRLDTRAQACHVLGAGIIENDVPSIPFEEVWRAYSNGPREDAPLDS